MIGYVVVISSAMAYLVGQFNGYWKFFTWKDNVEVLAFNENYVSIANIGDGEVFIRDIEHNLRISNHYLPSSTPVQINISPGKISTREFDQEFLSSEWATVSSIESKAELLKHSDPKFGQCIFRIFRLKTEPSYLALKELEATSIESKSRVYFFSPKKNKVDSVELHGLVLGFAILKNSSCVHFEKYHSCLKKEENKRIPNLEGRVSLCSSSLRKEINKIKINDN